MKKIIIGFLLSSFGIISFGYSEYALLLKDGFGGYSNALMYTRESRTSTYGLYIVEYGVGCGLGMWRYEGGKVVVNTGKYGTFLDGISDSLILPKKSAGSRTYTCKIWDMNPIEDELDSLEDDEIRWLYDNGYLE